MAKQLGSKILIGILYLLSLLPLSLLYCLAWCIYVLLHYGIGYRAQAITANLTAAFPHKPAGEIQHIKKRYYRYLADLIVEIIKLRSISPRQLKKRFTLTNTQVFLNYINAGTNVFGSVSHYGNWEWACAMLPLHTHANVQVIYKQLNNPAFNAWFSAIRSRFGTHMVEMRQTPRHVNKKINNRPNILFFCNDQSPASPAGNYVVNFLNQPTYALAGMEKLSLKTHTPLLYFSIRRVRRGYYTAECIQAPPELSHGQLTQWSFNQLEQLINTHPEYWLWSHRRWKHKPFTPA